MDKPISYMMTKSIHTVDTENAMERSEEFLDAHRLLSVRVVNSKGVLSGIISARDLVHFHSRRRNPKTIRAWEICTYKPIEARPTAPVNDVARLMVKKRIHHVVATENRSIQGLVPSFDFGEQFALKGSPNP